MSTRAPQAVLPREGFAFVKSVLSGDTLVLLSQNEMPTTSSTPPPEAVFSLSNISAPRAIKSTSTEEPGAYCSRNWLRDMCVGKVVKVSIILELFVLFLFGWFADSRYSLTPQVSPAATLVHYVLVGYFLFCHHPSTQSRVSLSFSLTNNRSLCTPS